MKVVYPLSRIQFASGLFSMYLTVITLPTSTHNFRHQFIQSYHDLVRINFFSFSNEVEVIQLASVPVQPGFT